ncbi:MAG TPA: hypothetical protein VF139_06325, partial [Candidatus Polarisedimenticolaceae bacterium]
MSRSRCLALSLLLTTLTFASPSLHAAVADRAPSRFDRLVTWDAVSGLGIVAESPEQIADFADGQAGWAAF